VQFGTVASCAPAPTKSCSTASGAGRCYVSNKYQGPILDSSNALTVKNPMIVPFAFWVNNTLQVNKCAQNPPAELHAGQLCQTAADAVHPAGFPCDVAADCKAQSLDDLSRQQVTNILAGSITDVSQLGPGYSSTSNGGLDTSIRVCLRQAGSGTQSTMHNAVMNADKWVAAPLATNPDPTCFPGTTATPAWPACLPSGTANGGVALGPYIFFNDSTDDLMNCINSTPNAIGIVDADACNAATANTSPYLVPANNVYNTNLCANIHSVSYNGYAPTRWNLRDGLYEFWTKENLYLNKVINPASATAPNASQFFTAMFNAINPTLLTYAKAGDSANIWATIPEMNFSKTDSKYPGFSPASAPQPF